MEHKIAKINDLSIWVPKGTWYSFFNSPYIGHREGSAIDIYYPNNAIYPFEEGVVEEIRKIRTPKNIPITEDFLIIIKLNKTTCVKILHVKPSVKVGDKLTKGDEFGEMILSGFFMPWSDRHVHLEIRSCEDKYRARGGYPIIPIIKEYVPSTSQNLFVVEEKKDKYYWITPAKKENFGVTPVNDGSFSIEGGLPYYKYGAIFGKIKNFNLWGTTISSIGSLHNNISIFNTSFDIYANNEKIKGLGIFCNQRKIKMIGGHFEEGEIVNIKILKTQ